MRKNGALDIICKIISVLLSIVLVASLIVTVVFASVTNLLKPETLTEIITDIDYSDLLSEAVGQRTAENLKGNNNVLSFNPILLMGYNVSVPSSENTYYDMPVENDDTSSDVQYVDENSIITIQGHSANVADYQIDNEGNIIYDGEVIGKVSEGENDASSVTGGNVPEKNAGSSDGQGSTVSIIGGSDNSTSIVVGSSSIDLSQFGIPEIPGIENPMEIVDDFMESDAGKEIVGEYTNAVSDAIQGNGGEVDKEKIKDIVVENKEEIIDFVIEYAGDKISRADIEQVFDTVVDEHFDEFAQILPEPQEIVEEIPREFIDIINIINSGIILKALIAFDAILIILMFVLRLWDFAGFLWLSVNGIVTSAILLFGYLVMVIMKGAVIGALPVGQAIFTTIFNAANSRILIGALTILAVAAILMVIFFIIKKFRKKKSEAK